MTRLSLSLDELDAGIAGKIRSQLAALPQNRSRLLRPAMLWGLAAGVLFSWGTSALITYEKPDSFLGMILGFLGIGLVIAGGLWWSRVAQRQAEGSLIAGDLRAVSRACGLTRLEAAYIDATAALIEVSPLLGECLTRDLLAQLNELAANAQTLETQRGRVAAAMGATPLGDLEREHAALVERLQSAPDEASRQAVEQSITLCEGRLAEQRALAPGLARVEAQQEIVYQTLASVESSLRRMSAVPAEAPALQVEEIRQATSEAVGQTRAVEDAIQEVLAVAGR